MSEEDRETISASPGKYEASMALRLTLEAMLMQRGDCLCDLLNARAEAAYPCEAFLLHRRQTIKISAWSRGASLTISKGTYCKNAFRGLDGLPRRWEV